MHDGNAAPGNAIKQCRFPDIWPSHDCDVHHHERSTGVLNASPAQTCGANGHPARFSADQLITDHRSRITTSHFSPIALTVPSAARMRVTFRLQLPDALDHIDHTGNGSENSGN